jgi:integrase
MRAVGRRRKSDDGLPPRMYQSHGAYYYVHRTGKWEPLGKDREAAMRKATLINDPHERHGTLLYALDLFIADCERRVALKSDVKNVRLSARTLKDYRDAAGTDDKPSALRVFLGASMAPQDLTAEKVGVFLKVNAEAGRSRRANLDRACLSAAYGWMLRQSGAYPGLQHNPCLKSSGVQRNPETKRDRYVTHDEYREVFAVATRSERLLMELTYRTLQRPESDIVLWDMSVIVNDGDRRYLVFRQNKTRTRMRIALSHELEELIPRPAGNVVKLREPLVRRLDGLAYTYSGLNSMLHRSIKTVNQARERKGLARMEPFGYRDLKGKGATDMYYIAKAPIEQIQQLLGHASKTTTEIYIKQRWRETAQPNTVVMGL